jgi:hypothetical protein
VTDIQKQIEVVRSRLEYITDRFTGLKGFEEALEALSRIESYIKSLEAKEGKG